MKDVTRAALLIIRDEKQKSGLEALGQLERILIACSRDGSAIEERRQIADSTLYHCAQEMKPE
jgi:hypothetical protein